VAAPSQVPGLSGAELLDARRQRWHFRFGGDVLNILAEIGPAVGLSAGPLRALRSVGLFWAWLADRGGIGWPWGIDLNIRPRLHEAEQSHGDDRLDGDQRVVRAQGDVATVLARQPSRVVRPCPTP